MELTARLYSCACCQSQVMICRHCDRGNIYCGSCAEPRCKIARKRASKNYQNSLNGKKHNAKRQSRYRQRQREQAPQSKKVTHMGSELPPCSALLTTAKNTPQHDGKTEHSGSDTHPRCHFCQCQCSAFLRRGFIRHVLNANKRC